MLLPGGKKIPWSWSESCVGCSWKSSEWTVEHNKLNNPMFGTPACLNILIAGLKPPHKIYLHKCFWNASALAHCLFPGHLFSHHPSDSLHTFRIHHSYPDPSYYPSCNTERSNSANWSGTAASITRLLECQTALHCLPRVRSRVNSSLDGHLAL